MPELTVVIPALDEARNPELLLPALGARVIGQQERGYGGALLAGFASAKTRRVPSLRKG